MNYDKLTKEIEELKEENKVLNNILQMQRKREYHSKFLKDFQKENGKNVFPDFDEIYKRYDNYKDRISEAIEYIKGNCILSDCWEDLGFCDFVPIGKIKYKALSSKKVKCLLDILKGADKE